MASALPVRAGQLPIELASRVEAQDDAPQQCDNTAVNDPSGVSGTSSAWEQDIRASEAKACAAFLAADLQTLDHLWAEGYVVNSPLQQVLDKPTLLALLRAGRIRHSLYEYEIEHIVRHGDVVVVMGNDRVADPPDGAISRRRFTNVWHLENGQWRSIARHAHVVSREAGS